MYKIMSGRRLVLKLVAPLLVVFLLVVSYLTLRALSNRKSFLVVADGTTTRHISTASTIGEALEGAFITVNEKDKVSPDLHEPLEDGITVSIKRAVNVTITADGETYSTETAEETVGTMLQAEGIILGEEDKLSCSLEDPIECNMNIEIIRVETRSFTETVEIAYSNEYVNDSSLSKGTTRVIQEGSNGEMTITYRVVCENGAEISREAIAQEVTVSPVNRRIARGTKSSSTASRGTSASSSSATKINVNGVKYSYSKAMTVTSTAYTGDTITHTGMATVRNPNGYSTIAVDPTVIPFGTKLYVEGYGLAVAADSGGAIKGNMIDVFLDTYKEAYEWGIKTVKIYILK